jgi:hypothetical protein
MSKPVSDNLAMPFMSLPRVLAGWQFNLRRGAAR